MPHWHARRDGNTLRISHIQPDDTGPVWAGDVLLWRGAPSWDSHRELQAGSHGIVNPTLNRDLLLHTWTWDLPPFWEGSWNGGDDRRYMTLSASGGAMNWRLVLRFPPRTPSFVFQAVAAGFGATFRQPVEHVETLPVITLESVGLGTMLGPQSPVRRALRGETRARALAAANASKAAKARQETAP